MTTLFARLRVGIRCAWPWALAATAALGVAGLLSLWFTPMLGMNLSINPDALLPQMDRSYEAANAAHPQACPEARTAPGDCRCDDAGARR